jgi:mono/diheme cytochrome c family protein
MKIYTAIALLLLSHLSLTYAADLAKGKEIYTQRCVTCHGAEGAGDGPVALSLPPEMKPRNLQNGDFKVTKDDVKMKDVIQKGGAAHGLNPLMPPHSDITGANLDALVAFVKSLKK